MNKIYKYICMVMLIALVQSCDSFLTYKSKDLIIPRELDHYEQLIFGQVIRNDAGTAMRMLEIMTDDVQDTVALNLASWDSDQRIVHSGWFTWQKNAEFSLDGEEIDDPAWSFFYHKILMCNIIEDEVSKFPKSGHGNRLMGEVQFMRAMSYFYLVNMYGEVYKDAAQAKTAYGVPINKELGIRQISYHRSKLQDVYDLIDDDLESAITLLQDGDGKKSIFRPNVNVARLLLSRSYLFQKRYDDAIRMATDMISGSGLSIITLAEFKGLERNSFYTVNNPGIAYTWGNANSNPLSSSKGYKMNYIVSNSLLQAYDKDDYRRTSFFALSSYGFSPEKCDHWANNLYKRAFRLEEAYLIRAEAYAERGDLQLALDDINDIREERIDAGNYNRVSSVKDEVIDFVREERRLEMCFEEMRWFDIRRWEIEIVHAYTNKNDNTVKEYYKLKKGSLNYVMPAPLYETRINENLEKLPREDCKIK